MKTTTALLFFFILVLGCNSPMNSRVKNLDNQKSLEVKKLLFTKSNLSVKVQWIKGPFGNINKDNHLLVLIYKNEELVSLPKNHTLEFYATMPSMAHPMEDAGFFEEVTPGVYINKNIRYTMPGRWKNELWIMDSKSTNITDKLEWHESF